METRIQTPPIWIVLGGAVTALAFIAAIFKVLTEILWNPLRIKKFFQAQGVTGPPYKLVFGSLGELSALSKRSNSRPMELSHDIVSRVLPFYTAWSKDYGQPFVYWFGCKPRLTVADPELIKEVLSNKFGHYGKRTPRPDARALGGNGLDSLSGEQWVQRRRIISPAFHIENLKAMIPTMAGSAAEMLENWQTLVASGQNEVDVLKDFRALTADVIARTAFGSSYAEGKQVFEKQMEQMVLVAEAFRSVYIPGYRFLPTARNRYYRQLNQDIKTSVGRLVEKREHSGRMDGYGTDLLGLMMSANAQELRGSPKNLSLSVDDIVEECKLFFFAGHETTSTLLTWTMMLLGMHREWQDRARAEVLEMCGSDPPDAETVTRLKIVGMVLNETLRLYPPVVFLIRQTTCKGMKLGKLSLPQGTELFIPILPVHHDPAIWGADANEFNPQRFAEGVAKASKSPMAFMPFGMGPRICIGQNFAMLEARTALAMILQRFTFHLSPTYRHAPITVITLQPQYGLQIVLSRFERHNDPPCSSSPHTRTLHSLLK